MADAGTVSSWVAAGISAFSAGITIWKAWYWQPTPQWRLEPARATTSVIGALTRDPARMRTSPGEQYLAALVNVGDGPALDVTVASSDCAVFFANLDETDARGFSPLTHLAQIPPAGQARLVVLPTYAPVGPGQIGRFEETPTPDRPKPEQVRVTLEWTVRPARAGRRRSRTIRIDDGVLELDDATRPAPPTQASPRRQQPR
ncbi:MAG: hypothetical protein KH937_03490 [Actinomyces urogenitalis]|uniref:hypothetical protein n=1 Tax=Actinomyces urogenitalis TaxID=103621 RepID=UPI0028FF81D1|nr:hypothetical protein [Actinomyces urogenitalis]MBS6071729.1 hypothetical protein [Actinomyces urogenitalis]MDU0864602.1 hypothetical protein [Actinomyces urogenitalis]MDU0875148.1 hypothetical protein [Actinomyces urogenitalis]MDU1564605.1 hypothetical protein [Actinomyces urogenitalis]MDU1640170.1 hypothetical protein [Actinomyces urogenitalis]